MTGRVVRIRHGSIDSSIAQLFRPREALAKPVRKRVHRVGASHMAGMRFDPFLMGKTH
jgi:hypothetical protein